jgi:Tol biopolymer transport system component
MHTRALEILRLFLVALVTVGCQSNSSNTSLTQTWTALNDNTPSNEPSKAVIPTIKPTMSVKPSSPTILTEIKNLSPGQYILVYTYTDSEPYLYLLNLNKEIEKKLPITANFGISNDGTQLLIMPPKPERSYNLDLVTKEQTYIEIDGECIHGSWSPDKRFLALSCLNQSTGEIYIFDKLSGHMEQITDCLEREHSCSNPSWSFDGNWLAYFRNEERSGSHTLDGVYLIEASCVSKNNCMQNQIGPINSDTNPTWSPANELILSPFEEIFFYEIKNNTIIPRKEINSGIKNLRYIYSSPDGKYLAYAPIGNNMIYILSRSTNISESLLEGENITIVGWLVVT